MNYKLVLYSDTLYLKVKSNGGSNDSTFGADAHEADGSKVEYKSVTLDEKALDKLLGLGGYTLKISRVLQWLFCR